MISKPNKDSFPLWQFLNQPLFDAQNPVVLHPQRFWHLYKVRHLESCWSRAYRPEEHFRN
jgi:hypothetical protein